MARVRRYVGLDVREVSLVAAGANQGARVTLFKSARQNVVTKASGPECRLCGQGVADADKYCKQCGAPFYKAAATPEDEVKKDEKAPEATSTEKAEEQPAAVSAEELAKSIRAQLEKEYTERLEKAEADRKAAEAETKKLEKAIRVKDANERVAKTMSAVPGETAALAEKLVELAETNPEIAKFVEETLAKCSELIAKGAVLEQKSAGMGDAAPTGGSVVARVEQLVASKRQENPKLSKAHAEAQVWKENPSLYTEYLKEQEAAR